MPELPEVETVARQLAPLIQGRQVLRLEIFDPKLQLENPQQAVGRVIQEVRRLGKQVLFDLQDRQEDCQPRWLCVHLRMTGRLIWVREAEPVAPPLRARLTLEEGFVLFKDVRRFGTMRLIGALEEIQPAGMDPFGKDFTAAALAGRLAGSAQEIKPWLLRQDRLVGLGNIYASEALFAAGLSPRRQAGSLTGKEEQRLHRAILKVLKMGIEHGGTTFSDFQDARGESGSFQRMLAVYGQAGQPCRRCRTAVTRIVQQGRSTFFCPKCQGMSDE
jgi:formamidopyrimidine-DNA glycosylase